MSSITIIGAGNMGTAIAGLALAAGSEVQVLTREATDLDPRVSAGTVGDELKGDVVVLALPYGAVAEVVDLYADRLDGKVVVDITNPLDFATFDSLVVPEGSSPTVPAATRGSRSVASRVRTCTSLPAASARPAIAEPMVPAPMMVMLLMVASLRAPAARSALVVATTITIRR